MNYFKTRKQVKRCKKAIEVCDFLLSEIKYFVKNEVDITTNSKSAELIALLNEKMQQSIEKKEFKQEELDILDFVKVKTLVEAELLINFFKNHINSEFNEFPWYFKIL